MTKLVTLNFAKRLAVSTLAIVVSAGLLHTTDAQAKRMGSGGSKGKQSSNVSNRTQAQPEAPKAPTAGQAATPAAGAATAGAAAKAPAAAAAASSKSKWLGPLAGLAAGLGLAWLASSLGFGEGFANIMMILLLVMVAFMAFRFFMARRNKGAADVTNAGGMQPAYSAPSAPYTPAQTNQAPALARSGSTSGSMIGSAIGAGVASNAEAQAMAASDSSWRIPSDMDVESFLAGAKSQYVKLQAAYDRGDLDELHSFTTQEMYKELAQEVAGRGGRSNVTQVVSLQAGLLGVETDAREHTASVRFTGQINEDGSLEAIDEVWNLTKPVSGFSGWVLAGIQQY